jgi:hypothetical protein
MNPSRQIAREEICSHVAANNVPLDAGVRREACGTAVADVAVFGPKPSMFHAPVVGEMSSPNKPAAIVALPDALDLLL